MEKQNFWIECLDLIKQQISDQAFETWFSDVEIVELGSEEMLFADDVKRADASAKFLRHLTYNHNEVVKAVMSEVKSQIRSPEFDLYK